MDRGTRVLALGGGAGNALNHLVRTGALRADLVAVNADAQDLRRSLAPSKVQVGAHLVRGLGCGGDPEVGRDCALADRAALTASVVGAGLVILTVSLGGGTGSGAAPVVCKLAAELGAQVVAVVTLPFPFEGRRRRRVADDALVALTSATEGRVVVADTPIPAEGEPKIPMQELFARSDATVAQLVRAVIELAAGGPDNGTLEPGLVVALHHLRTPKPPS